MEAAATSDARRRSSPGRLRRAWRRLVYRRVRLGVWGTEARSCVAPTEPLDLSLEIIGPEGFAAVLGTTPYLTAEELADFEPQATHLVVVRDGDRIVASAWATTGSVYVDELHRVVAVPEGQHHLSRGYVRDGYRGRDLLGHMLHAYAAAQPPGDLVWGLADEGDEPSVRAIEAVGWRRFGDEWTDFVFTRRRPGSRRYAARSPFVLPRGSVDASPVALILAEETYGSCIQAMRSIAAQAADVYVAVGGRAAAIYEQSRACTAAIDIPESDARVFCDQAVAWMDAQAPDARVVVIPLSDRLLEFMHHQRERFPDRFVLAVPDPELTEALLDKETSLELAGRAGLEVPRWVAVHRAADAAAAATLRLPVIVRPTAWSATGPVYFKIIVCRTAAQLEQTIERTLADGAHLIVQEYIEAPESAVELSLVWRSRDRARTAMCTGRKRRQTEPDGGVMAFGEAVDLPDVREATTAFLDRTGFTGLGGAEFIRHDGHLWFVEFNPRLEAIHFLGMRAGVDTLALAYRELASNVLPERVPAQQPATAWVGTAWLKRVRAHRLGPVLFIVDRLRFGLSPNRIRSIWTWRDPRPGLALSRMLLLHATGSSSRPDGQPDASPPAEAAS